jgi:predicted MFS family arabinose efflux permease
MIAVMAGIIAIMIMTKLKPVNKHLSVQQDKTALAHLLHTIINPQYGIGFISTALLSIGGFMMMPFGAAFAINNLGVTPTQLPLLYMVSGVCAIVIMPFIGKLADKIDKFKMFVAAAILMIVVVVVYTHMQVTPLWIIMVVNVFMMIGIMSRMVPAGALITGIPEMKDRGAFMSINSSLQQIAGGIAASAAGMIVVQQTKVSPLEHYDTLGYVMVVISVIGAFALYQVSKLVKRKLAVTKAEKLATISE